METYFNYIINNSHITNYNFIKFNKWFTFYFIIFVKYNI